jgi:hypothetical protein
VASVDHTGLLITQRARMCGLVLCGSSAGQSRRKNDLLSHPGRESHVAVCMPAARKEAI